jgi:hypothetical protein
MKVKEQHIQTDADLVTIYQAMYANAISLLLSSKEGLDAKAAIDF